MMSVAGGPMKTQPGAQLLLVYNEKLANRIREGLARLAYSRHTHLAQRVREIGDLQS